MTAPQPAPEVPSNTAGQSFAPVTGSAAAIAKELARVRDEVKPTRRGVMIMAETMGQMLKLGWHKDQLDALEILFWAVRDADGRVKPSNAALCDGDK